MARKWQWLGTFLFPPDSGCWLSLLRVGLGFQIILYAVSLRADWSDLYGARGYGLITRALVEAAFSGENFYTPRLGWLVFVAKHVGLTEATTLSLVWVSLVVSGLLLITGWSSRLAAGVSWFLYLCSVKSGAFFAYGVDNFTTIGLFYLMIAPLPDPWSLDSRLRKRRRINPERLGFHRRVLQLHLCVIYFFSGISKSLGADWWNGNSVWRALTRPPFDLVPPGLLMRFEYLLPAIGILVCLLETGYPVFIWMRRTRAVWLTGILGMHISIGLTMGLYLFALIMIVLNLAAFGPDLICQFQNPFRVRKKTSDIPPLPV
ncbi:MAG TPA: HTTM domain-containing protein [Chthoniobacterales bacterium]|nr:HTTM domain-containing protein [Chthoniobacterales bacterium]